MQETEQIIQPMQPSEPVLAPVAPPYHANKPGRTIAYMLLSFVLLLGVIATVWFAKTSLDIRSKAANTGPVLSLNPPSKSVTIGETFSVGMTLHANTSDVSAVEIHMTYDPIALQIVKFTPGTILPVTLLSETHQNGEISVVLASEPTNPFQGSGIVGTWTVKSLTAAQTTITIADTSQVAVIQKDTNALEKATGSTITANIQTGSSTSSVPTTQISVTSTPTATHTPTPTQSHSNQPTQASFSNLTTTATPASVTTPTPYVCTNPKNPWFCKSGTCFEMSAQFDSATQLQCGKPNPITCASYLTTYIQTQPPCYTSESDCVAKCK